MAPSWRVTSVKDKKRRLSRLQRTILQVLEETPNKAARILNINHKVARRYSLNSVVDMPLRKGHYRRVFLSDSFSVSFSRAMASLEAKRLVELLRGEQIVSEAMENRVSVIKKIVRRQSLRGKVTLIIHHKSPFFHQDFPQQPTAD